MMSRKEHCALYRKIDGILGDHRRDEGNAVTYLTLKASWGLSKQIVNRLNALFQTEFPELYRKGRLEMDFRVWGEQLLTQLCVYL